MLTRLQFTDSQEVVQELERFKKCVVSSFGPCGRYRSLGVVFATNNMFPSTRISMLEPILGGHVTLTCQSSQLFQLYKSQSSFVEMLCMALQSHANSRDGGKFGAIFCTRLV